MIKGKTLKQAAEEWAPTAERYICYIDIMGFKNLVERNSHEFIYAMMKKVSRAIRTNVSAYAKQEEDSPDVNITMTTYSDSIMVYSRDDSQECLSSFLDAVSSLTEDLFIEEIPYKGAVAHGLMTLDTKNSIFFGQPLIDAYLLSEELSYYGVILHSSAEFRDGIKDSPSVVEYKCPLKTATASHYTIIPYTYDWKVSTATLTKAVRALKSKTSGGLRKYIDNTLLYFEYLDAQKG